MTIKTATREITKEEFLTAYNAAPPEIRKEVRRLLAEDCRSRGDIAGAEHLLNMKD